MQELVDPSRIDHVVEVPAAVAIGPVQVPQLRRSLGSGAARSVARDHPGRFGCHGGRQSKIAQTDLPKHADSTRTRFCRLSVPDGSDSTCVACRVESGMTPTTNRYLSFHEREEVAILKVQEKGVREIARQLRRAPSTISRELRRNAATRGGKLEYRASVAQWKAELMAQRPKTAKLVANERLREYVQQRLAGQVRRPDGTPVQGPTTATWNGRNKPHRGDRRWVNAWSPEQIANRLELDFPDDESMRISHEAIYQSLYVESRGALKRELVACLRTGRALRVPRARARRQAWAHVTPEVMISERPAEAEDRAVPGHWEGDLLIGLERSAIGTLVERTTRFFTRPLRYVVSKRRGELGRGKRSLLDGVIRRRKRTYPLTSERETPEQIPRAATKSSTFRVDDPSRWPRYNCVRPFDSPAPLADRRKEAPLAELWDLQDRRHRHPSSSCRRPASPSREVAFVTFGADHLRRFCVDQCLEDEFDALADHVDVSAARNAEEI